MKHAALLIAIAACGKKEPEPRPWVDTPHTPSPIDAAAAAIDAAPPAPVITFAVGSMSEGVAVYRTGPRGVELVHHAPSNGNDVLDLAWTAPDALFVRLEDGSVAAVRGDAIAPLSLPPAKTWRVRPTADEQKLAGIDRSLVASGGELWLGLCQWGHSDGEETSCDEWAWARLAPAPVVVRRDPPPLAPDPDPPTAPPSSRIVAEIVPERVVDAMPGDHDEPRPRGVLRCTIDRRTIEFPPDDARDTAFEGVADVRWLSTEPPLMVVDVQRPTYDGSALEPFLFEGCTPVAHGGELRVGPEGVLAMVDDGNVALWWHGRELGRVPGDRIAFAPPKP